MDIRWAGDDINRIPALARELVGLRPDIILAAGNVATAALQRETRTIPIVFAMAGDPVANEIVTRLDRRGGLVVLPNLFPYVHHAPIISAATRNNVPAVYPIPEEKAACSTTETT
jgi:ABC-type uncharacterized transport system substrate-binding protein